MRLSPSDLLAAGGLVAARPTAVSPLDAGARAPLGTAEADRLRAAGVLDGGGLTASARATLEGLATASAVVRMLVAGGDDGIDVALYRAGDRHIALVGGPDAVLIRDPADPDALLSTIWHHTGASGATIGDLDVTLHPDAALTLLAVIDVERDARLATLAGIDRPAVDLGAAAIGGRLAATARPSLAPFVGTVLGAAPPDAGRIAAALSDLESAGWVERNEGQLALVRRASDLARGTAVIERTVHVRAARVMTGDAVTAIELGAVQGNGPGVLIFERGAGGDIHLRSASTNELIAVLAALVADMARPAPSPSPTGPRFCVKCGTPLVPEAKFCGNCGTGVDGAKLGL
ncbi:MAG: zinc ribbon domain-containing protein [Chloroflexota bacterium]|nr:zinc ribbon domain-containing protein [Chloroflexota bacterium]MDE3194221.1 zinc ribbon domain-containing protein [Chloroflexota bacterium]